MNLKLLKYKVNKWLIAYDWLIGLVLVTMVVITIVWFIGEIL